MTHNFCQGDSVSFKNEALNGTIIAVLANGKIRVNVNGFDMDVQPSELIKISTKKPNNSIGQEAIPHKEAVTVPVHFANDEGVYLVSTPAIENQVTTGPINLYVDNNSSSKFVVVLSLKTEGNYTHLFYGVIAAFSNVCAHTLQRNYLSVKHGLVFQAIEIVDGKQLSKPVEVHLPLVLPNLAQSHAHLKKHFSFAQIQTLISGPAQPINLAKLKDAFSPKLVDRKSDVFEFSADLEVDLHIEKLLPSHAINASEALDVQIQVFRQTLNSAIMDNKRCVTFIHGVGDGILKQKIINELKDYKGIKHKQAPILKYGLGAIEVILK
jgi:hypothetical protein